MNTAVYLSAAQRRQLEKIVPDIERATRADRLFFERRPERQYQVRLASRAEIEERRIIENLLPIPDGCRAFMAVFKAAPCIRLRALAVGPEGAETDLSESEARAVFEWAAGRLA